MRMRLLLTSILVACSLWAQPSLTSQIRIGPLQFVELGSQGAPPEPVPIGPVDRMEVMRKAIEVVRSGPAALLPPAGPDARAIFEIWADHWSTDLVGGLRTSVERQAVSPGVIAVERSIRNGLRQVYVRYSVMIEPLEDGKHRLTFGDAKGVDDTVPSDWNRLSPNPYPVPQIVEDGESVAVMLYSEDEEENALTDYVHVGHQNRMTLRNVGGRDAFSDDASLAITAPRVRVDGVPVDVAAFKGPIEGRVLSLNIPGIGVYRLAVRPRPGFQKSGEVTGGHLVFQAAGHILVIDCAERMAVFGSSAYNVYGVLDSSVRRDGQSGVFEVVEP